jgi:pimeloyl-ACP methyl ester carboxylesterase
MKTVLLAIACLSAFAVLAAGVWAWAPDKPRSELEPLYLRSPGDYLDVAGLRLHVRDDGPKEAPAIILLHGLGSSLHTWEPWARRLSQTYRVVRYDLPGAGLTGPDPAGDYGDERGMAVLGALMDRLGIARASLIGNSMGGRLAWMFAAHNPARVAKLVLISPDGFESPGFKYGQRPDVPAALKLMRYLLPKSALRMNLEPAYADAARLTEDAVTRYYDLLLAPGVRSAMLARMQQTVLQPPEPLLRRIAAPTLLLWGEKDAMIPVANAEDYETALGDATLAVLPGLGHVPHEEAPDASLAAVEAFLRP